MILDIDQFLSMRRELPVVDVRSEGEFAHGHVRAAVNIPILNNAERVAVGTDYKQKGQAEAIRTGFRLVGPRLLDIITDAGRVGNEMLVHCWRGGMRSSNFCQFASMAKIKTHQLEGGYKAYRQLAQKSFEKKLDLIVVGGCTGSGKSEILRTLKKKGEQVLDLELLANHKGSAFGALMMPPQPTTEQFENEIFETLLEFDLSKRIWIEDESAAVGRVSVPLPLWHQMGSSSVLELDVEKSVRIERLVEDYGKADTQDFLAAMEKIVKRLGGQNFNAAKAKLLAGDLHATIEILLSYYDRTYSAGLEKKKHRIKLRARWNGLCIEDLADELIRNAKDIQVPVI